MTLHVVLIRIGELEDPSVIIIEIFARVDWVIAARHHCHIFKEEGLHLNLLLVRVMTVM